MAGRGFIPFTVGLGIGYVLGTRAGRERYEELRNRWDSFAGTAGVRQATQRAKEAVTGATTQVLSRGPQGRREARDIREVMTATPETLKPSATLAEAASKMKEHDAGAMIVVDESEAVVGIITDRDIAVRAVAEGRDPAGTRVGEIASKDLLTLSPQDSVEEAVRLMRERSVRRLPVVEHGRPIGIVSLGDLAAERDPDSVLADISTAPGNR